MLPADLSALLEEAGKPLGNDVEDELTLLLLAVKRYISTFTARIDWLPIELQDAIDARRAQHVATAREKAHEAEENEVAEIKFELLHRSARTKSGYVGVYANGKGFRAMGQIPKGPLKPLGTYKTAELAAWQRYLWYVEHQIPYGELADEMELHRKKFNGDENALKTFSINLRRYELGDPIPGLSDADVELAEQARLAEERLIKPASVANARSPTTTPAIVADDRSEATTPAIAASDRSESPELPAAVVSDDQSTDRSTDDDPMTFLGVRRSQLAAAREDATKRGVFLGFDGGLPDDLKFPDEE